eukprot:g8309.t1
MAASETANGRGSPVGETAEDTTADPPRQGRTKKRKRFPHGNYTGYYATRYGNGPSPSFGSSASAAHAGASPALVGARDARLGLMRRSWFEGKKCLDVGCNEGHLTIAIVRSFRPRRMVGIDIDSYLVQLAKRALAAEINTGAGTGGQPAFRPLMPRSLRGGNADGVGTGAAKRPREEESEAARDDSNGRCSKATVRGAGDERNRGAPQMEDGEEAPQLVGEEPSRSTTETRIIAGFNVLQNGHIAGATSASDRGTPVGGGVTSSQRDTNGATTVGTSAAVLAIAAAAAASVVADAADAQVLSGCMVSFRREDFVAEAHGDRGYDVICLFSVVKWMHINGGDKAVREVFRKAYDLLSPGGRLILEPQPWKSYKKSARQHGSAEARVNVETIKLRPPDFPTLLTEEVGFRTWEEVGLPAEGVGGFAKRSVHVFLK